MNYLKTVLLWLIGLCYVRGLEINVDKDESSIAGERVYLVCEATNTRGGLNHCTWSSPGYEKFREDERTVNGIRVVLSRDRCILQIANADVDMMGMWECILEDDNDKVGKFVFLNVYPTFGKFEVLLDSDESFKTAVLGEDLEMLCPSNHVATKDKDRAICKWFEPNGKSYDLIGKKGEIYNYFADGIEFMGDPDKGDCGILVRDIQIRHTGTWRCQLLRQSPHARGSEVTSRKIEVDVFRSARYENPPALQGYEENDRNVVLTVSVPKPVDSIMDPEFYWVIQRKYVVYEGEDICRDSRNLCYKARNRRTPEDDSNVWDFDLEIDELTELDLEDPVALVMEYRTKDSRNKKQNFKSKIFKVTRKPLKNNNRRKYKTDDNNTNRNDNRNDNRNNRNDNRNNDRNDVKRKQSNRKDDDDIIPFQR